jgi:long-chain acyl-CoA synthetase
MTVSTRIRHAALIAALLATPGIHAAEVAGLKIDDTVHVGNSDLVLNGAGIRSKFFVKVYVGALYVGQKATTPAAIYDSNQPKRMVLRLLRDLDSETLQHAMEEGLKNNLSEAEWTASQPQVSRLDGIMKGIGKAREGDSIAIDFNNEGIAVAVNGNVRGKVEGGTFGKALLKVWLGEKPADASLKKALLGG